MPSEKIHTHYDNLQVTRNASIEVIRGAYKHLSQKWHPDKHPEDRERAERVMKLINEAYGVLSDPDRRREHDEWIAQAEHEAAEPPDAEAPTGPACTGPREGAAELTPRAREEYARAIASARWPVAVVLAVIALALVETGLGTIPMVEAWLSDHQTLADVVELAGLAALAWAIVAKRRRDVAALDEPTLKLLYAEASRKKSVRLVAAAVVVAGLIVAGATLWLDEEQVAPAPALAAAPAATARPQAATGIQAAPASAEAGSTSASREPPAEEASTSTVPAAQRVRVQNDCNHPVQVMLASRATQGRWSVLVWDLEPEEGAFLTVDDLPYRIDGQLLYYYARVPGKDYAWAGNLDDRSSELVPTNAGLLTFRAHGKSAAAESDPFELDLTCTDLA